MKGRRANRTRQQNQLEHLSGIKAGITNTITLMRKKGEKNCRALVYLTEELGLLVVVSSGAEPGESSDQGFASLSTGDREDILDPVELKFLNDNLPTILKDMRTSETQFSIPSSKGPGLSVCLEKGKHEDLQDKEGRFMDAIAGKEIACLLEQLENAKTSQDSEAEQAYNRAIPHLLNNLSTIPLDLIGMVYKIEPKGSYPRRIILGFFLDKRIHV